MASETAGASGLGERYATALYDLADEQKVLDAVAADLRNVRALIDESADLRRMIRSPVLSRAAQGKAIAALAEAADFQPLVRNILGLLAQESAAFRAAGGDRGFPCRARFTARRGHSTMSSRRSRSPTRSANRSTSGCAAPSAAKSLLKPESIRD